MSRTKREMPTFFSFEIGPIRSLAEAMTDEEWGRWSKNALNDLSIGCVKKDTDPRVIAVFEKAKGNMDKEYKRKSKWYHDHVGNANDKQEKEQKHNETQTKPQPGTPDKPSLAYSGRGGNVHLTDDEYAMLLQELGNKRKADKLIDSLDYAISEGKIFNAKYFHVLMHWNDYREEKAAEAAETAKARAAANADAFGNVDRRTPYQKNQDELHQLYVLTSEKLKELK